MRTPAALVLSLILCSVSFAQDEEVAAEPVAESAAESAPKADSDEMQVIMKPKQTPAPKKKASKKKKSGKESKTAKAQDPAKRDKETSLRYLTNGNSRFVKKNFRSDGRSPADRERGLEGQTPHSAILASSDSRVVPEIIFDQGLGEVFSVRTLSESIDDAVIASLEYAVDKLKVPLLVVLGNSDDALMKLRSQEDSSDLSDGIKDLIDAIDPRLKTLKRESPSPSYDVEATLNADAIARELTRKSSIIKSAVESGRLTIKSALYRINTGRVTFY